jgi:hypothetical protein
MCRKLMPVSDHHLTRWCSAPAVAHRTSLHVADQAKQLMSCDTLISADVQLCIISYYMMQGVQNTHT